MNNIELENIKPENIKKASIREKFLKLEENRTELENLKKRIEFVREGLERNMGYSMKHVDAMTESILKTYRKKIMDLLKPCVCEKITYIETLEEVLSDMLLDALLDEFFMATNEVLDLLGSPESK